MEQCQGHSQRSLTLCIGHLTFRRLPASRGLITKGVFTAGREFLIMVALYPQTFSEPQPSLPDLPHHSPHPSLKCNFLRLCFGAHGSRDRKEIFAPLDWVGRSRFIAVRTDSRLLCLEIGSHVFLLKLCVAYSVF